MRNLALVVLLLTSTGWAQEPAAAPPPASSPAPAQAGPGKQTLTIPEGTRIPLSLTSQITTKARAGTVVRAVTGFPITVGTQVAMPVGTYVEGVIDKISRGGRTGPTVQMHFTRILFPNGYSLAIEGANTQARLLVPPPDSPTSTAYGGASGSSYAMAGESTLPTPTLPSLQPHTGVLIGVAVGGAAAAIAIAVLTHAHYGGSAVLFDAGWQFEMVLQGPVSVDVARAGAAPGAS